MSDEISQGRVGCGPVGGGILVILLGFCVLLTVGSGLVVLFPGPVIDLFERDADEPDRLRAAIGSDGTPTVEPDAAEPVGSASNPAAIGIAVGGDGVSVTLNAVARAETLGGVAPKDGFVFLTLDVTIANVSDEATEFSALFWSARDIVAGENYDDDKFNRPGNALPAGSLAPGDQIRGNVLVLVAAEALVVRVKYDTALIGGENLYWLYPNSAASPTATPAMDSSPVASRPGSRIDLVSS